MVYNDLIADFNLYLCENSATETVVVRCKMSMASV